MKYSEYNERYRTAGVYMLVFGEDFYIGSSMNLQRRVNEHQNAMRTGKNSIKLNEAWEKYRDFRFEVLEYVDSEKPKWYLRNREDFWIKELNPTLNGIGVTLVHDEKDARWLPNEQKPIRERRKYIRHDYSTSHSKPKNQFIYFYFYDGSDQYCLSATMRDDEYLFPVRDIAYMLGYSETIQVLKNYVNDQDKYPVLIYTDNGHKARFININGVISILVRSKKKNALAAKEWFINDVLPQLSKSE